MQITSFADYQKALLPKSGKIAKKTFRYSQKKIIRARVRTARIIIEAAKDGKIPKKDAVVALLPTWRSLIDAAKDRYNWDEVLKISGVDDLTRKRMQLSANFIVHNGSVSSCNNAHNPRNVPCKREEWQDFLIEFCAGHKDSMPMYPLSPKQIYKMICRIAKALVGKKALKKWKNAPLNSKYDIPIFGNWLDSDDYDADAYSDED